MFSTSNLLFESWHSNNNNNNNNILTLAVNYGMYSHGHFCYILLYIIIYNNNINMVRVIQIAISRIWRCKNELFLDAPIITIIIVIIMTFQMAL